MKNNEEIEAMISKKYLSNDLLDRMHVIALEPLLLLHFPHNANENEDHERVQIDEALY